MTNISSISLKIKASALELGFDECGISRAEKLTDHSSKLDEWLTSGFNADMEWMHNNLEKRIDPTLLVPGAKSVISVLLNYYNPENQTDPSAPVISRYAYGKDYHKVMKKKLLKLLARTKEMIPACEGRVFTDSAPIMEHAWAERSGLGWIGRNSLLLNKKYGSYVFLGEMIIDTELEYDQLKVNDHCGTCTLCINECPTNAILPGRMVDANKCISYQTIENKGDIPDKFRNSFYNRVFGCDICQDVCPWNRKLSLHKTEDFHPSVRLLNMTKEEWYNMSKVDFDEIFHGSPVKRAGYSGLRKNLDFLSGK